MALYGEVRSSHVATATEWPILSTGLHIWCDSYLCSWVLRVACLAGKITKPIYERRHLVLFHHKFDKDIRNEQPHCYCEDQSWCLVRYIAAYIHRQVRAANKLCCCMQSQCFPLSGYCAILRVHTGTNPPSPTHILQGSCCLLCSPYWFITMPLTVKYRTAGWYWIGKDKKGSGPDII